MSISDKVQIRFWGEPPTFIRVEDPETRQSVFLGEWRLENGTDWFLTFDNPAYLDWHRDVLIDALAEVLAACESDDPYHEIVGDIRQICFDCSQEIQDGPTEKAVRLQELRTGGNPLSPTTDPNP